MQMGIKSKEMEENLIFTWCIKNKHNGLDSLLLVSVDTRPDQEDSFDEADTMMSSVFHSFFVECPFW